MASGERTTFGRRRVAEQSALAREWRRLGRAATFVAVLTSPATFAWLYGTHDWPLPWALLGTFVLVIAFRGFVDVLAHKLIPRASLYGAGHELMEDDIVAQRRVWYWRRKFRLLFWLVLVVGGSLALLYGLGGTPSDIVDAIPQMAIYFLSFGLQLPLFFFMNIVILFGPMLFFGLRQMKGYEPGDADWGVKLEDVRGQAEPKAEVTKVIELWSAGEEFRKAGGKPERGLLFIGAPGTGKTMLSKGIATSFNSPIVTMPGSGFAQTFIGMDVVIVMALIRKARKLARKWGNTCMIFIDEIDAVGMRRQALQGGNYGFRPTTTGFEEPPMYGPWGSLTPTGDLILENRQWRERMFMSRAEPSAVAAAGPLGAVRDRIQGVMFPGMGGMGGGLALNQLLVQMDGVDEPPMMRKFFTNRLNTFLDATYIIPRRIRKLRLRIKPPKPRPEQVYFIGATNVPLDALDPALIRPGRMGRHIWFRTPTKDDRKDIFDLYLDRVSHDDGPRQRRAPRRAGAHDERVLPGHDRAGVLDGADLRALRGARAVRPQGHRRGDDDDRVGHRRRRELHRRGEPRGRHPRGRPRRGQPRLHERRPLHAAVDPHARRLAGPPPGDPEGGALLELAPRGGRQPRVDARRHGRRARLLRRELQRRGRRHPERHLDRVAHGGHERHGPRAARPARARRQGAPARGREGAHGALRAHRPAAS